MDNKKENNEEQFDFMKRIDVSSYNIENRPFNLEDVKQTKNDVAS